jgi:glucosamine--fructose-6-phosphate aminotransferase (isomerizing)
MWRLAPEKPGLLMMHRDAAGPASLMSQEAAEAPAVVARMRERNRSHFADIVSHLKERAPTHILLSARGSSDHAASYLKYLCEIRLGLPCCSMGPSVASIYGAQLRLNDTVLFSISQSGQSADLLSLQAEARRAGVLSIAITNQETSPLARNADICLALHAGVEQSPAASKSFIASAAAAASLIAAWAADRTMLKALEDLPAILEKAKAIDWRSSYDHLARASSLFVIGRGPSFAMAQEAALKLKETSALHAEAYSAAEVMHGPLELLTRNFPVLAFCPADEAEAHTIETLQRMSEAGANVIFLGRGKAGTTNLGYAASAHPLLDPISLIQSFYRLADDVAKLRGRDPDRPRLLNKETSTL